MNYRIRQWFFCHYWWIALILAAIAIIALFAQDVEKRWEISAAAAGIAASLVYFVQKQKVDEINLFQRLFTEFNTRYGQLHDQLQEIIQKGQSEVLSPQQRNALDQYFNLCAEEYLFWIEGRILPSLWQSWCRGMLYYLEYLRIDSVWSGQVQFDSHYGLSIQRIEQGAGRIRAMRPA